MKATFIIAAFATVFAFTPAMAASNLVLNGGFETGDFSGWAQWGDMGSTLVYGVGQSEPVADGAFSAAFGPETGYGAITQTIDTVPGANYTVTFLLANTDPDANDEFMFSFDDGFQIDIYDLAPFDFEKFILPVTASGLSADVSMLFYNPSGYFLLDDVTVTAAVPEPTTWCLLLAGFATIGTALRRRKRLTASLDTIAA